MTGENLEYWEYVVDLWTRLRRKNNLIVRYKNVSHLWGRGSCWEMVRCYEYIIWFSRNQSELSVLRQDDY